jgi:hypothetical protein
MASMASRSSTEPLPLRLLRLAPEVDLRIVADRGPAEPVRSRVNG